MNIKIANLNISNDERMYGTLIKDLEKMGYLLIQDDLLNCKYTIARKEDKE